jgi:outer membrane lipase/esterase
MRVARQATIICGSMLMAGASLPAMGGEMHVLVASKQTQADSGSYDSKKAGGYGQTKGGGCAPGCDCAPTQPNKPSGGSGQNQSPGSTGQNQSSGGSGGSTVNQPPPSAPVNQQPGAPLTFAAQGDIALISAMGFASTLFGRLDLFRQSYGYAPPVPPSYPVKARPIYSKALPLAPVSPWSFYMLANGGVSDRQATVASDGFNLDSVGGTIGVEYRINPNAFIGAAFDYSNAKAHLFDNAGSTEANSYQLGLYGGWTDRNFFVQALAAIGYQDYRNTRPGIGDTITSSPDGSTFVIGGKTGYLFDIGPTQLGPIGGLTYAHAQVNGYTESGNPALTFNVGRQTEDALIGSVGMQLRAPFVVYGRVINPYLNLTAEDDFIGDGRLIQFNATSTPVIVNNLNIPNSASRDVYGRVTAGVVAPVWNNVSFTANVSRSFARQGGDDFYGSGGLKVSF